MNKPNQQTAIANASVGSVAGIGKNTSVREYAQAHGRYTATCLRVIPQRLDEYLAIQEKLDAVVRRRIYMRTPLFADEVALQKQLLALPTEEVWKDTFDNLVTTIGKNFALDTVLAGSGYTAAWYIGLVDGGSAPTYNAADTMASHAGWTENQSYSQSTRVVTAWSSASAAAKSLSANLAYSINATVTIAGCFLCSVSTKGGTTGTLYSCGSFTGGNKSLVNGETLNVGYTGGM